ncbi:MAG TPA: biotin/lipoyl-binding protein, partial [Pseudolabrys sp.]
MISPKISGYISEVPVNDNQSVKAGQVIVRIDPRDYQTALDQAHANVAAAQTTIDSLTQQIARQKLTIDQAQQTVTSDQAAPVGGGHGRQTWTLRRESGLAKDLDRRRRRADQGLSGGVT